MLWDRNRLSIATPVNDKFYILEWKESADGQIRRFWQPPQILPIRRLAIIDNVLHGHSSAVPESYKLFDGTNDNDNSFKSAALFAYRNFGDRVNQKNFNEFFTEGFIAGNTTIKMTLNYDLDGATQALEKLISGGNQNILFGGTTDESLAANSLADMSLAGDADDSDTLPKFRTISEFPRRDFFEIQVKYETDDVDQQWEIMAHGPAALTGPAGTIAIKQ